MSLCALQAQDYFLWCSQLISAMAAEESISDVATADLQLVQHQQLWAEMEARQETYQQALDMGEELQIQDRTNRKEVRFQITGCFCTAWCQSCLTVSLWFFRCLRSWRPCRRSEISWRSSGTRNKAGWKLSTWSRSSTET